MFAVAVARERRPGPEAARLAGGLALALVPAAYLALLDPPVFLFNVLGHHAIRSESGLVGDFAQKATALAELFDLHSADGIQFALLDSPPRSWTRLAGTQATTAGSSRITT